MYWKERSEDNTILDGDQVVDVSFRILCSELPIDHAWRLSEALLKLLPWLADAEGAGIHQIHGAQSGNGWTRPDENKNQVLVLSKRERFRLRCSIQDIERAKTLTGRSARLDGFSIQFGEAKIIPLIPHPVLFARYVSNPDDLPEEAFIEQLVEQLDAMKITVTKLLCGRNATFHSPGGELSTQSLMLADLPPPDSLKLQQQGLGPGRLMGFGLFVPHKGGAVNSGEQDT